MSNQIDHDRIRHRENAYCQFWGCEPDGILHQTDEAIPHIDTYRFSNVGQSIMAGLHVYLTGGMSDLDQPHSQQVGEAFRRIEFSTFSSEILMNESGKVDFIGWILGWMAHFPFENDTLFLPGETFDWGRPIVPGSEMEGFYFAMMPFVDRGRLCQMSGTAKSILHLVTISRAELNYRLKNGVAALIDVLGKNEVLPVFDPKRESVL